MVLDLRPAGLAARRLGGLGAERRRRGGGDARRDGGSRLRGRAAARHVTERAVDVTDAAGARVRRIPVRRARRAGGLGGPGQPGRARQLAGERSGCSSTAGSGRTGPRSAAARCPRRGSARATRSAGPRRSAAPSASSSDLPLLVPAFAGYPVRVDTRFDPASGAALSSAVLAPSVGGLALPRARVLDLRVERHLAAGWDVLVAGSLRRASRLATLDVVPRARSGWRARACRATPS